MNSEQLAADGTFCEYDGMILRLSAELAAADVARWTKQSGFFSRWRYERGANHEHPGSGGGRQCARQEQEQLAEWEEALRRLFPLKNFVLSWIPMSGVSFYQPEGDAPTSGIVLERRKEGTPFCYICLKREPFTPLPEPDREFPEIPWIRCDVCGNDIVCGDYEILRLIGPEKEKIDVFA